MKAAALTRYLPVDDPESLFDTVLPTPVPGPRDLLVAVRAVSVNPLDNRVRRPKDKIEPAPRVLGWDAAGVVTAVGSAVTRFKPGDAVYYAGDITRPGSNSEYQLVEEAIAGHKPDTLGFEQAAALPLSALTAWEALFDRMRIPRGPGAAGKRILIVGAAGGVGSMAVQLASRVAGLTVIGTASRPESQQWVRKMGAHAVVDHGGDMPAQLRAAGYDEVDYVLLLADTDRYLPVAAQVVRPQGTIGLAVEMAGPFDLNTLWDKSITLAWQMVFTRTDYRTHDLARQGAILDELANLVDAGLVDSTVTQVLAPINAANLRAAHATLAQGRQVGKIVLKDF